MKAKLYLVTIVFLLALVSCRPTQPPPEAASTPIPQTNPVNTPNSLPTSASSGGADRQFAFLAQVNGQWDIYLMDIETRQITNLTNDLAHEDAFRWSPDGQRLVYRVVDRTLVGQPTINWIINADGSSRHQLLECPTGCGLGDWAPDGRLLSIMMIKSTEPLLSEMDVIQDDGTNLHPVTNQFYLVDNGQKWSPNQQYIGFHLKDSENAKSDLAVTDAGGAFQLLTMTPDITEFFIGWSPDSTKILFSMDTDTGEDSYHVLDLATRNITAALPFPEHWTSMRWLENGQIFVAGGSTVFSMQPDGSGLEEIIETPWKIAVAAFSPDGQFTVLGKFENADPNASYSMTREVFLAGRDGSLIPMIHPEVLPNVEDVERIAWRP